MSTHNISFYEDLKKFILELLSNIPSLTSSLVQIIDKVIDWLLSINLFDIQHILLE